MPTIRRGRDAFEEVSLDHHVITKPLDISPLSIDFVNKLLPPPEINSRPSPQLNSTQRSRGKGSSRCHPIPIIGSVGYYNTDSVPDFPIKSLLYHIYLAAAPLHQDQEPTLCFCRPPWPVSSQFPASFQPAILETRRLSHQSLRKSMRCLVSLVLGCMIS